MPEQPALPLEQQITRILMEILELSDASTIQPNARLREDLGMDSLNSLEMLSRVSEELRINLEMEEAMQICTVSDACHFIDRNLRQQSASTTAPQSSGYPLPGISGEPAR